MKSFELAELLLQNPNQEVYIEVPYNDTWENAFESRFDKLEPFNLRNFGGKKSAGVLITWDK